MSKTSTITGVSIGGQILLTSIYVYIIYTNDKEGTKNIFFILYGIITLLLQFVINYTISSLNCTRGNTDDPEVKKAIESKRPNFLTVALSTAIPWSIFLLLVYCIQRPVCEGWVGCFANTIGYATIYSKAKVLLDDIKKRINDEEVTQNKGEKFKILLESMYNDKSTLINEIHNSNLDPWYKILFGALDAENQKYKTLKLIVNRKTHVSYLVWIILFGMTTSAISTTMTLSSNCH